MSTHPSSTKRSLDGRALRQLCTPNGAERAAQSAERFLVPPSVKLRDAEMVEEHVTKLSGWFHFRRPA